MCTYAVDPGFSYGCWTAPLSVKEIHMRKGSFYIGTLRSCVLMLQRKWILTVSEACQSFFSAALELSLMCFQSGQIRGLLGALLWRDPLRWGWGAGWRSQTITLLWGLCHLPNVMFAVPMNLEKCSLSTAPIHQGHSVDFQMLNLCRWRNPSWCCRGAGWVIQDFGIESPSYSEAAALSGETAPG